MMSVYCTPPAALHALDASPRMLDKVRLSLSVLPQHYLRAVNCPTLLSTTPPSCSKSTLSSDASSRSPSLGYPNDRDDNTEHFEINTDPGNAANEIIEQCTLNEDCASFIPKVSTTLEFNCHTLAPCRSFATRSHTFPKKRCIISS